MDRWIESRESLKRYNVTSRFGYRTKRVIIIQADKVGKCWTKRSIGYIGIWTGRGPVEVATRGLELVLVLVLVPVLVAWQAMSGADEQRAYCTISQSQGARDKYSFSTTHFARLHSTLQQTAGSLRRLECR